jgi:hypothetical protein
MANCPSGKQPVTIKAKGGRKARTFCASKTKSAKRGGSKGKRGPISAARKAALRATLKRTCEDKQEANWPGKSAKMIPMCSGVLSGLGRMGRRSRR